MKPSKISGYAPVYITDVFCLFITVFHLYKHYTIVLEQNNSKLYFLAKGKVGENEFCVYYVLKV